LGRRVGDEVSVEDIRRDGADYTRFFFKTKRFEPSGVPSPPPTIDGADVFDGSGDRVRQA
jgi:hypothetical protein